MRTLRYLIKVASEDGLGAWRALLAEIYRRADETAVEEDQQIPPDPPALDAAAEMIVDGCWNLANVDLELRRKHYPAAVEMVKRLVAEASRAKE